MNILKRMRIRGFLEYQRHTGTDDNDKRINRILERFLRVSAISHYQIKVSMYLRMDE